MERQAQQLVIRAFWLEPGVRISNAFLNDVQKAINQFAQWQGANHVILENAPPEILAAWSYQWAINS
jgi:uncharacterized protein YcaQ